MKTVKWYQNKVKELESEVEWLRNEIQRIGIEKSTRETIPRVDSGVLTPILVSFEKQVDALAHVIDNITGHGSNMHAVEAARGGR